MGGAIAVHAAVTNQIARLAGLVVVDVVEGMIDVFVLLLCVIFVVCVVRVSTSSRCLHVQLSLRQLWKCPGCF